ncbi:MAG: hypothetical protein ACYSWP_24710 [Planctomycetota bacterium]|jgi:hypothetical protein
MATKQQNKHNIKTSTIEYQESCIENIQNEPNSTTTLSVTPAQAGVHINQTRPKADSKMQDDIRNTHDENMQNKPNYNQRATRNEKMQNKANLNQRLATIDY